MPSTVTQLARTWRVSHQYVSKLAKKGMPLNCEESASNWRDTYARQRPPTDRKQLQLLHADQDSAKGNGDATGRSRRTTFPKRCLERPLPHPDCLEYPLECPRSIAHATHILLQQALEDGRESRIVAAFRNYNAAVAGRLKIEERCRKEAEYRRHLVPMKEVRLLMRKTINVVVSRLVALPDKVGAITNPEAPAHAIAVLRDECASIIADIKKNWPKEFDDGVVWPTLS
jgi:hypothetical protein